MKKKQPNYKKTLKRYKKSLHKQWQKRWLRRTVYVLGGILGAFLLWLGTIYAFYLWYNARHTDEPRTYGVTFIADYARYFDLDPKETMLALRDDLGFKRFRLVSYWKNIEPENGQYDFSELDWQLKQVEEVGGEVSLAIGLRQPRWPECHFPNWVDHKNKAEWYPELKQYMKKVVERYKDSKVITSYQLENEHFLSVFGECTDFSRERLEEEFALVKSIDPDTPVILSLANNYFGVPFRSPQPDQYGVSVYKRVYDYTVTKNYLEYPFPAWYYGGRAGMSELLTGKDSMLHELQAEPWAPVPLIEASIEEQSKSMDAERLAERIEYAKGTGFRDIDLWGGEWWYWRLKKFNDPSIWNTIKNADLN